MISFKKQFTQIGKHFIIIHKSKPIQFSSFSGQHFAHEIAHELAHKLAHKLAHELAQELTHELAYDQSSDQQHRAGSFLLNMQICRVDETMSTSTTSGIYKKTTWLLQQ